MYKYEYELRRLKKRIHSAATSASAVTVSHIIRRRFSVSPTSPPPRDTNSPLRHLSSSSLNITPPPSHIHRPPRVSVSTTPSFNHVAIAFLRRLNHRYTCGHYSSPGAIIILPQSEYLQLTVGRLITDKMPKRGRTVCKRSQFASSFSPTLCLHTALLLSFCNFKERKRTELAAYAALVNVMHIIEQIQHHPSPPISLDQKQVQSLTETITFLQDFLEVYPHDGSQEAYDLEGRIRDATRAAEDVIKSHIVDRIRGGSTSSHGENSNDLYKDLGQVIKDIDFIKKEVVEIKAKKEIQDDKLPTQYSILPVGSLRTSSPTSESIMVDDILNEILERLTRHQSKRLQPAYPNSGHGRHRLNKEVSRESLWGMSEEELGEKVYKTLFCRKYLIVMDDMWTIEVWDKLKHFFPDNNKGSRIMITTRLSNLSFDLIGSDGFSMKRLDDDKNWNLLCKNVFGEEGCPRELEKIGKKIAETCKGLPLSIAVIGGLIAKSERIIASSSSGQIELQLLRRTRVETSRRAILQPQILANYS
ncbi:hypothetical protein BUALT_Bualt07G0163500 [Buddleja alternifolia]|uniref:NB-ARC domain-containing protein n=1 Tax=Buddleja alternifolia TaxID=168488 RepID=A0AAV6XJ03_9LAMI|nr:hypothetical protein BUALT_Bualt07G0163500 [Buddleja alternifolia]